MYLLVLLTIICCPFFASAFLESCGCSSLSFSSVCPTQECANVLEERDCRLGCRDGGIVYYKSGLPWKSTPFVECEEGKFVPSGKAALISINHITCARPPACDNCSPLRFTATCPSGMVCENALAEVFLNECRRISCRRGNLIIVNGTKHYTVHTLTCSEGENWQDANGILYDGINTVTCAMDKDCGTCQVPQDMESCEPHADCSPEQLQIVTGLGGCRIAKCQEHGFLIRASNGMMNKKNKTEIVHGISEMNCNTNGEWIYKVGGASGGSLGSDQSISAVCYWPKCKKCMVSELDCLPEEECDYSLLNEPSNSPECDQATCQEGYELVFQDDGGFRRAGFPLQCNHQAFWTVVGAEAERNRDSGTMKFWGLDDESRKKKEELEASRRQPGEVPVQIKTRVVALNCRKSYPDWCEHGCIGMVVNAACQRCPDLRRMSGSCPPGVKPCGTSNLIDFGGKAAGACRFITCADSDELWALEGVNWVMLGHSLSCTESGFWQFTQQSPQLPSPWMPRNLSEDAAITCRHSGDCHCKGARLGTSSACDERWKDGCDYGAVDLFAVDKKEGCSVIQCRYNGTLALYEPGTENFIGQTSHLTCGGSDTYYDNEGHGYTPHTASVTCHSWQGNRHCARHCGYETAWHSGRVQEGLNEQGCTQLTCEQHVDIEVLDEKSKQWIARSSLHCSQLGTWTSPVENGAFIIRDSDKPNMIMVRCNDGTVVAGPPAARIIPDPRDTTTTSTTTTTTTHRPETTVDPRLIWRWPTTTPLPPMPPTPKPPPRILLRKPLSSSLATHPKQSFQSPFDNLIGQSSGNDPLGGSSLSPSGSLKTKQSKEDDDMLYY